MAKKIIVNGGFIVLSDEVINELHRQERIEEGQRIAKKFVSKHVYNKMADADFEKVTLRDFVLKLKIKDLNKACEFLQAKDVNLNNVVFTKENMPEYRIFCENSRYSKRKFLVWRTDKIHGHFHGIAYMVCNEQYRRITYSCHSWNDNEEKSMRKFIWPFMSFAESYQELTGSEDEIKYVCELIKQYVKYNELERLQFNVY